VSEPVQFQPGDLVQYYDEGWRTGHVDEQKKSLVWIRPIAAKGAAKKRIVKIPSEDVKPA